MTYWVAVYIPKRYYEHTAWTVVDCDRDGERIRPDWYLNPPGVGVAFVSASAAELLLFQAELFDHLEAA